SGRTNNMEDVKQRHECLTAWLILMIIANSLTALMYLIFSGKIKAHLAHAPVWTTPTLVAACIANVIFSVALFQWKKWGFFGFVGTTILALAINLRIGVSIGRILFGLIGIAVLYAVLRIGDE